jgi:hypothetical protein
MCITCAMVYIAAVSAKPFTRIVQFIADPIELITFRYFALKLLPFRRLGVFDHTGLKPRFERRGVGLVGAEI